MASALTRVKAELWRWKKLGELRRSAQQTPACAPERTNVPRVLIGPTNSAGQGYQWARAFERARPETQVTSMQFNREQGMRFPVDLSVASGFGAHSRSWQRHQMSRLRAYDGVLVESGQPVAGGYRGADTLAQIRELQDAGVNVGLIFHGSDIRDPHTHMREESASYFQVDERFTSQMAEAVARNQNLVAQVKAQVLVSTLDLLTYLPHATWLPVVVDPEAWETDAAPLKHGGIPKVVHVPSSSLMKGTDLIAGTLEQLDAEGVIRYVSASGVDHKMMPELYRDADIVLDQFRGGPYGVAACEAMAAGRIVISHVPHRDRVLQHAGEDLPILQATHENLAEVIQNIVKDPSEALRVAGRGPGFVARHHDGRRSGKVLSKWFGEGKGA